jgi:hypothetical protein
MEHLKVNIYFGYQNEIELKENFIQRIKHFTQLHEKQYFITCDLS